MFCITYWLTLKYCSKWLGGAISSSQLINHVGFWKCKECLVVYITSVDNFFWCRQNVDPHRCQCHKPWTSLATEYVATVQVLTDREWLVPNLCYWDQVKLLQLWCQKKNVYSYARPKSHHRAERSCLVRDHFMLTLMERVWDSLSSLQSEPPTPVNGQMKVTSSI